MEETIEKIIPIVKKELSMTVEEVRELMSLSLKLFRDSFIAAGYGKRELTRITTKFRDAGRRSAPWKPTSSRVPGRPQDGADGNRINRWLLPKDHKFYANEINATLVELKYIYQTFSMTNSPKILNEELCTSLNWLLGHQIEPCIYLDPIQIIHIDVTDFIGNARLLQSGHLIPLDRGGKHVPENAFLMLKESNDLQGNLTLDELLQLMEDILERHKSLRQWKSG